MGFDSFDRTKNILNFIYVPVTLKISRFDVDRTEKPSLIYHQLSGDCDLIQEKLETGSKLK